MSTLNNTVKDWLQNALLQLGAESYLYGALDIGTGSGLANCIKMFVKGFGESGGLSRTFFETGERNIRVKS